MSAAGAQADFQFLTNESEGWISAKNSEAKFASRLKMLPKIFWCPGAESHRRDNPLNCLASTLRQKVSYPWRYPYGGGETTTCYVAQ
jgi:hypothetical protein